MADITERAISTLKNCSFIACEDTRHAKFLLDKLGIAKPLVAYFDEEEAKRAPAIIERIKKGESCALISDAGTPVVCDPGFKLVQQAYLAGEKVFSVPGPSSVISALTLSGIAPLPFTFVGFVPEKKGERESFFNEYRALPHTLVCFESARRLNKTLQDVAKILGESRVISVAREMTKLFEEVRRGPVFEVLEFYEKHPAKGEIVLVIEKGAFEIDENKLAAELKKLLLKNSLKDAAKILADIYGVDKKSIYQLGLKLKS